MKWQGVVLLFLLSGSEIGAVSSQIRHNSLTHNTAPASEATRLGLSLVSSVILNTPKPFVVGLNSAVQCLSTFPGFRQAVETTVTALDEATAAVPLVQLNAQVTNSTTSDDVSRSETCIYRKFSGSTMTATTGLTVDPVANWLVNGDPTACATAVANLVVDGTLVGYVHDTNSGACSAVVATLETSHNSAVCIRRGGCDGTGASDDCVWSRFPDLDLSGTTTSSTNVPLSIAATEGNCIASCEAEASCIGYSWRKQTTSESTPPCSLHTQFAAESTSSVGICLRELYVESKGENCWKNKVCEKALTVQVPTEWGQLSVEAVSVAPFTHALKNNIVKPNNSSAVFQDMQFTEYGSNVKVKVTSLASTCPPSVSIDVDSEEKHIYFLWDANFPAYEIGPLFLPSFLLIKFHAQCTQMMAIMLLVLVFGLNIAWIGIKQLVKKRVVVFFICLFFFLLSFVIIWDFYHTFIFYGCQRKFVKGYESPDSP